MARSTLSPDTLPLLLLLLPLLFKGLRDLG